MILDRLLTEVAGFTDVWTLLQPSVEGYTFSAIEELIKRVSELKQFNEKFLKNRF